MPLTLTAINRYPVKSCRGEPLDSATVEPWGLAGDRRWMVVGEDGEAITARTVHRMLLIEPRLTDAGLNVRADGLADLDVNAPADGPTLLRRETIPVTVHGKPVEGVSGGAEADAWFTAATGQPARLVFLVDPTIRPTNPAFSRPEDRVSYADAYPVLLTTEESLAELNELIAAGPLADQGPLSMTRFRTNLVVSGSPAWAEESWRRVRIGDATFRAVKGCDRCVLTTIDPETAAKGKEPIATLARHRRRDGATWFGMNLIADTPGVNMDVGDPVEILETADTSSP